MLKCYAKGKRLRFYINYSTACTKFYSTVRIVHLTVFLKQCLENKFRPLIFVFKITSIRY